MRVLLDECMSDLAPTSTLGIVFVRVVPNVLEVIQPALENLIANVPLEDLVGSLTVVWRDRWQSA